MCDIVGTSCDKARGIHTGTGIKKGNTLFYSGGMNFSNIQVAWRMQAESSCGFQGTRKWTTQIISSVDNNYWLINKNTNISNQSITIFDKSTQSFAANE